MPTRRNLLKATAAGLPLAMGGFACWSSQALAQAAPKTFVLAHGSWHGGWCWKRVADQLRAQGHVVYAPSYTGMGDRAHLLTKDITINTFVEDIVQVIQSEELTNVILVGHSFGGVPISGAADRIPEKIAQLVYLDSVLVESGRSAFSYYPLRRSRHVSRPLRKQRTAWRSQCRSQFGVWERKVTRITSGCDAD